MHRLKLPSRARWPVVARRLLLCLVGAASGAPFAPPSGAMEATSDPVRATAGTWPCAHAQDLYVVAHPDDDLLFMNPDLATSVRAGHCVLTVYLTTGDNPPAIDAYNAANHTAVTYADYAHRRRLGLEAAYARMSGQHANAPWSSGMITTAAGQPIHIRVLVANPRVVLAFLNLPEKADGTAATAHATLDDLYYGRAATLRSAEGITYTADGLTDALGDLLRLSAPDYLHFQDSSPDPLLTDQNGSTVADHADHIVGARFLLRAADHILTSQVRIRYRGYNTSLEPAPTLGLAAQADKNAIFGAYAQQDLLICPRKTDCTTPAFFANWSNKSYSAWLRRQYFNIADDQAGSLTVSPSGTLRLTMTGDRTSTIRTVEQAAPGTTRYGAWRDLGGNFAARPVLAAYPDGRLAAVVLGNSGSLHYSLQTAVDGSWTPWKSLGGNIVSDAALTLDPAGQQLQLFAVNRFGQMMGSIDRTGMGGWTNPQPLPGQVSAFRIRATPMALRQPSGQTMLIASDDQHGLREIVQNGISAGWKPWSMVGSGFAADLAASVTGDRIDVFMRGLDNGLYTRSQTGQEDWTPWTKLAFGTLQFTGRPIVASTLDGRLDVFVRDFDTSIVRFTRPADGAEWLPAERLPTTVRTRSILGAAFDGSGRLSVLSRSTDGQVYATSTGRETGGWTPWNSVGH